MPKKNRNELLDVIAACGCVTCRALIALKADAGANILISRTNTGRMCEMAVVAAAGAGGITGDEVVAQREAYARHLGVELPAGTRNNPTPFHIQYAIAYSNHTTPGQSDKQPFNLGRAHASCIDGRYRLLWDALPVSSRSEAPMVSTSASKRRQGRGKRGIEIAWPDGIERIELDLDKVGLQTVVTNTVHHLHEPAPGHPSCYQYTTSSSVAAVSGGAFRLTIAYASKDNKHIRKSDSSWGFTTILLRPGDTTGAVEWTDAGASASSGGAYTFHAASWDDDEDDAENDDADETERARRADEAGIEARTDLTSTQKARMIQARRGQGKFRLAVLGKEACCRVTGIDDPAHLRASHIKAWAACNDEDRLDGNNGLMLAPHIDHLFDKGYISFDDDGNLLVREDPAIDAVLKAWGINPALLVPRPFNARQRAFLAEHRRQLTRGQEG